MARETLQLTDRLHEYMLHISLREPDVLRRLGAETAAHPHGAMQLAPEQAQLLALLVRIIGARRTIEVGVFTGYSSLAVALALPDSGRIIACDVSEEYTTVARRYWAEAGVAHKIDLRIGPAAATLDGLLREGEGAAFDFAFVDADKAGYIEYYERLLKLVRPGGLIAADNIFRRGEVVDTAATDPETEAIRRFNEHVRTDPRVHPSTIPIGDGMTIALVRGE